LFSDVGAGKLDGGWSVEWNVRSRSYLLRRGLRIMGICLGVCLSVCLLLITFTAFIVGGVLFPERWRDRLRQKIKKELPT
jgi:hypothetical protein